jgi:hypothetical protein
MRKLLAIGAGVALSFAVAGVSTAAETTVTGHLRDAYCFIRMGAHGPSHKTCAIKCAKAGIPVLLVTDSGKTYTLLPPKDAHPYPPAVIQHMEDKVTVTGNEYSKGGQNFLTADSVK